ncbi:MAG: RNA-guided endonuclease InsQ/TnpB family protein, partial [Methanothrix sp.]
MHRPIVGRIKTCSIKRDKTNAWYVIFTTDLENPTKRETKTAIGVDLGITHAAVTSDGQYFDYPKYYVQAEKKNRAANKSLHRKKLGSNNRKKAQTELARIAKRVTNLREEFLHQVSRKLVNSADRIIFEDLSIQNMLKNHRLAKHIQDVSWGKLIRFTMS